MSDRKVNPKTAAIRRELESIRKRHRGMLRPSDVIEFATDKKTALHAQFEWDDSEAGHQYRLWQAQHVIRVHVTIVEVARGTVVVHPEFVSPNQSDDYRPVVEVLSETDSRLRLLQQTIRRLASIKEVALFPELNGVSEAISKASEKYDARRK